MYVNKFCFYINNWNRTRPGVFVQATVTSICHFTRRRMKLEDGATEVLDYRRLRIGRSGLKGMQNKQLLRAQK